MLFNSIEFLIFLPIVFILYWFVFNRNLKLQNLFVVAASYIFYGWWDWKFLVLIAFTSFCSWGSGLLITREREKGKSGKWVCAANIVINLLILGTFKYYNFFLESLASIIPAIQTESLLLHVILPVGISFYTFQALSYSIDVYRGKINPTRDVIQFFAFVSFFPQLVAGPIERATNLLPQFERRRVFDYKQGVEGCYQILWGLFKKVVVADNCALYVDQVFSTYGSQSASTLLLAAVFFSFQIYGDFSGYSDIAIGTAKLFGIKLMRNFNIPYFSRDIAEFWRRWHISLTTWFRDYVYIPLGGSRVPKGRVVFNTFVIFLLSGFWHGANWTFVLWGVFNALLFLPLILAKKNRRYTNIVAENRYLPTIKECGQMLLTFFLVTIGWIIFRSDNIAQAGEYLVRLCNTSLFTLPEIYVGTKRALLMIVVMVCIEWVARLKSFGFQIPGSWPTWLRCMVCYIMILIILEFAGHSQSFIYFQF